jgi:hypothetical protein
MAHLEKKNEKFVLEEYQRLIDAKVINMTFEEYKELSKTHCFRMYCCSRPPIDDKIKDY